MDKLADKRVALIGTGSTGIQLVPHLGRDAKHLYVLQRTPSTVDIRGQQPTDPEWVKTLTPGWHERRRNNFLSLTSGADVEEDLVKDSWTDKAKLMQTYFPGYERSAEEKKYIEEELDFKVMNELRDRVDAIVKDHDTAEILKPWYRYMCKRPTFSDEYLETFNRPNVTIVDTADYGGVEAITENAVVVGGKAYEVDCIVFATGFEVGRSGMTSGRLPVYGRDGKALFEYWMENGVNTLHGLSVHSFPNLFNFFGFHSAASVNFTHILDEQAKHVAAMIAEAKKKSKMA